MGVRNYVGVISTVGCANDVAHWIAQQIKGTAPFLHQAGCGQLQPDLEIATRTLISIGQNPNLAGVLLVSLGCEGVDADRIEREIAAIGRPVKKVVIQKAGATVALNEGLLIAQALVSEASQIKQQEFDDSHLVIGVKCGGSDTTSGLASNPAVGAACDIVLDNGGTCIFGETTEFLGLSTSWPGVPSAKALPIKYLISLITWRNGRGRAGVICAEVTRVPVISPVD